MPSLLQRLGQGLGKSMEMIGASGLEEQRQMRLAKMQDASRTAATKSSQEFQTAERVAGQEFKKETTVPKPAKVDEVKFRDTDEMTGKTTITYNSGKREEYDPETDKTRILGQGKGAVSDESKGEDKKWAEKMANREAGTFSGDASDFPIFKDETKAAEAAAQFRSNARKAGELDQFDTEFAKKGWSYIQDLAGGTADKTVDKAKPTKAADVKAGKGLMNIFRDFDNKDYDAIATQIMNDPKAPKSLKDEASNYLKGAS